MKNRAAQALAAILAIIALSGMCFGGALPFAGTVGTPKDRVEAVGTATAIAPAIVPTVRYNEVVLPTQQAVEANEITETIERKYKNARQWDDFIALCKKAFVGGLTIFAAIAQASGAGALIGAVLCYIVERVKRARFYEPVQSLDPYGAYLFPRTGMATQMLHSGTWSIVTEHPADVQGGALLVEARIDKGSARYRFTPRMERDPVTIDAWKEHGRYQGA